MDGRTKDYAVFSTNQEAKMEHPRYYIGDRLPLEVVEKILVGIDAQSAFLRTRSVSKTWLLAVDALIQRNKMPSRTYEERVQFALFKFLSHYRHLLDQPKATPENKAEKPSKKDKKNKKEKKKSKEKKSKKDKSKKIEPHPVQEPEPEPKVTQYNIDWLRKSLEMVLLALPPSNKFLSVEKEKILLRVWLFAEEENTLRHLFASNFKINLNWRIPLIGGYFMMIPADKFLNGLEEELRAILKPYKDNRLEVDDARDGYQPTHIDTLIDMSRKAATATANLFKLLPSKILYVLKLLQQANGNSSMVLAQFFMKFIIPSVTRMFDPRAQKQKKIMPSAYNARHLHLMAVIIQSNLQGSRIREPYMERANNFSEELKKILILPFEELLNADIDMNEVDSPLTIPVGESLFMALAVAAEILSEENKQ